MMIGLFIRSPMADDDSEFYKYFMPRWDGSTRMGLLINFNVENSILYISVKYNIYYLEIYLNEIFK